MNVKKITTAAASLILITILSTACRHHREVVYVNGTPPPQPTTTVVYNTPPPPVNNTVIYANQQPVTPPVVSITYPANNFISAGNYITVRGNVQNILLAHQINVSQNGYPVKFFSFDPFNGNFHFQTFLQQGANNIIVTANNAYGTGSQGVTIVFNPAYVSGGVYNNGGNYPNPNANNIVPNGGNYPNPNANNIVPNGGNYPNNQVNPNANNIVPNGGNYPNNSVNPNSNNIVPNGGGYPNNSVNPNANNIVPNGGSNNYNPNGGNINPYNNGGNYQGQGRPIVQYINPSSSPEVVTNPNTNISAFIQNITNASQINVNVNGSNLPSFNFNPSNHSLNFGVNNLLTGFNSIHISATNSFGTASQSTVIDYKPGASAPPRIQIFNPATSPFSSLQPNMIVSGYVYNVTSSSEISATFNGNPVSFNYNQGTQEIDISVNLTGSNNQLIIKANNPAGNASQQVTLTLASNIHSGGQITGGFIQPNLNINNGNNEPHTGQQNPNIQTGGSIQPNGSNNNINNNPHTGQQNPNLSTNGSVTYIDQTNTNNNPHVAQQNPNLSTNGSVTYIDQPKGGNSGGTTNNGMAGIHNKPEITRTSPATSPYTTMSGVISAAANVNFVTNASEVSVTYNGSPVSFSYNPQISEALNFTSPLSPGMNTFVIKATNSLGTVSQDIEVNYVPTNTSGNSNGNPNVHFTSGTNIATNTPKGFTPPANNQKVVEPVKTNTIKPLQQSNEKKEPKK